MTNVSTFRRRRRRCQTLRCVSKFDALDFIGTFTYNIAKRQSVPFGVSPRVAKRPRDVVMIDGQLIESALCA